MEHKKYLGNIELLNLHDFSDKLNVLNEKNYGFFHAIIYEGDFLNFNRLSNYNVICLNKGGFELKFDDGDTVYLGPGDVIYSNRNNMKLEPTGSAAALLIAGVLENNCEKPSFDVVRVDDPYKVKKPWGQELWLNVLHPSYALKEIRIKAGYQTSLQYHERKEETFLLTEGRANLIFQSNGEVEGSLRNESLSTQDLEPMQLVHIPPRTLHRLIAKTDICLYEVSTAELDDVVRVADDFDRENGRIDVEHIQNK